MKRTYNTLPICIEYDETTGKLTIMTVGDTTILDRDEASTLAEKLQDWLLQDD